VVARRDISQDILVARHKFLVAPGRRAGDFASTGLRIESFAVINLRGVSTNKTIICFIAMQTYKEFIYNLLVPITVNVSQVAHHLLPHNTY
jgi:hypothetical protein